MDNKKEIEYLIGEINSLTVENRKLKNIFYSVKNYLRYIEDEIIMQDKIFPDDIKCPYIKELVEVCSDYIE